MTESKRVPDTMLAARLHEIGAPLQLDCISVPSVRPLDVLVQVKACGVVPNLRRVIGNFFGEKAPDPKLFPPLPAIFGLDSCGIVVATGERVTALKPGDRVYVNPARSCGSCRMCRLGKPLDCPVFTYQGYFGRSQEIMAAYPYGGLCQYQTAPASAIVKLPDDVSFYDAAKLGYLGTVYAGMKKIGVGPGNTVLVNGISGMLGLCGAALALAMGADKILGVGRKKELLERVRALAPDQIHVYSSVNDALNETRSFESDPLLQWSRAVTNGEGVDGSIDCLPPGAPANALLRTIYTLRRGGKVVNVGAVTERTPLDTFWMMTNRIGLEGSTWFTTAEGEEMVSMVSSGKLDLSIFEQRVSPLSRVNEALESMDHNADGGFVSYIIDPSSDPLPN